MDGFMFLLAMLVIALAYFVGRLHGLIEAADIYGHGKAARDGAKRGFMEGFGMAPDSGKEE